MAKTKPIGVRFDQNMLDVFKEDKIADTPQQALNFLHQFYIEHNPNKLDYEKLFKESKLFSKTTLESYDGGKTNRTKVDEAGLWVADKKEIPQPPKNGKEYFDKQMAKEITKHPLWKEGDPAERTMAFFMKYDANTYDEIKK